MFKLKSPGSDLENLLLTKFYQNNLKFPFYADENWMIENRNRLRRAVIADIETNGKHDDAKLLEICLKGYFINPDDWKIVGIWSEYSSLQDPYEPIPPEITDITGITDDLVKGQNIDWEEVKKILREAQVCLFHNAKFDGPKIAREPSMKNFLQEVTFGCTLNSIEWKRYSNGASLPTILIHVAEKFFAGHRAEADVDVLAYILNHQIPNCQYTFLKEAFEQSLGNFWRISAVRSRFELKDKLKARDYKFDGYRKVWFKDVKTDDKREELTWLQENIYFGRDAPDCSEISSTFFFKNHS